MKKHTILTALTVLPILAFSQVKPPKTYQLYITVDSAQYVTVKDGLSKALKFLNTSDGPHNDVSQAINLVYGLNDIFEKEHKTQDSVYKSKEQIKK